MPWIIGRECYVLKPFEEHSVCKADQGTGVWWYYVISCLITNCISYSDQNMLGKCISCSPFVCVTSHSPYRIIISGSLKKA